MIGVLPSDVINVSPGIRLPVLSAGLLVASSDTGTNGSIEILDSLEGTGMNNGAVDGGWSGRRFAGKED